MEIVRGYLRKYYSKVICQRRPALQIQFQFEKASKLGANEVGARSEKQAGDKPVQLESRPAKRSDPEREVD